MADKVFVAEYGTGARPAVVVQRFDRDGQARIVVEFTDDRGGVRDCFATSVFDKQEDAATAAA